MKLLNIVMIITSLFVFSATTYVIREGDKEVGRWVSDDESNEIVNIDNAIPKKNTNMAVVQPSISIDDIIEKMNEEKCDRLIAEKPEYLAVALNDIAAGLDNSDRELSELRELTAHATRLAGAVEGERNPDYAFGLLNDLSDISSKIESFSDAIRKSRSLLVDLKECLRSIERYRVPRGKAKGT